MLWCIPTNNLRFPRRKGVGRRGSNWTEDVQHNDAATDPGVYYLVTNNREPTKTAGWDVRPTKPRLTPSNENWDEATTRAGRAERRGYTRGGSEKREVLPPQVLPPPPDKTTSAMTPRTAAPKYVQKPPADAMPSRKPDGTRLTTSEGTSSKDRQREGAVEAYGEYAEYMSGLERQLAGSPELPLSPGRNRDHDAGGARVQRAKNPDMSRISKPTRLGTVGKAFGADLQRQLRPQRSLEMMENRAPDNGPEQVVTISTWREQVADEADQSANLHIYYMDPHSDGDRERPVGNGPYREGDQQERNLPPRPGKPQNRTESDVGSIRTITDEESTGSPPISRKRTPTETDESSEHANRSPAQGRPVNKPPESQPSVPWNPTPPHTPPHDTPAPDRGRNRSPNINGISGIGSASPVDSHSSARRTPEGMRLERAQAPVRSSTPNWTYARHTMSSFHPTRSGSTISTIKSASVIAFENVLATCEPPLLHISPALERVGVRSENHLRAIARLSEETRDKEIREAALKQGVTVMEWAILLDRLQSL